MTLGSYIPRLFAGKNKWLTLVLALALLCALLRPINLEKQAVSYQVTFDISQSMYVEDAGSGPELSSRLKFSKDAALHLLQHLPCGSKLGWSVFSGSRVISLLTPLDVCIHYDGLVSSLESIQGNMRWTNSSQVGKGVHKSMRLASEMENNTAILIFTDGHEAPPLEAGSRGMPAIGELRTDGILVGVGGLTPARIPKYDAQSRFIGYWGPGEVVQIPGAAPGTSNEELSEVREVHLKNLARLAELSYVHMQSVSSLTNAISQSSHGTVKPVPTDLRWIPAALSVLLLCWYFRPTFAWGKSPL